jgi:hypothetical protein
MASPVNVALSDSSSSKNTFTTGELSLVGGRLRLQSTEATCPPAVNQARARKTDVFPASLKPTKAVNAPSMLVPVRARRRNPSKSTRLTLMPSPVCRDRRTLTSIEPASWESCGESQPNGQRRSALDGLRHTAGCRDGDGGLTSMRSWA